VHIPKPQVIIITTHEKPENLLLSWQIKKKECEDICAIHCRMNVREIKNCKNIGICESITSSNKLS
jgi:hypothetical protein